ncbi:DUF2288 domain-containing protein [Parahaliea mediterranea]|uniref:DUF2288 domain-containing protein n=1 Tax=Parahaliea mediterranea TaxID=651086 RepID=A0A939IL57_9GAMM|nr:DUF2288 domain-containing protein [Parahaliea mediterranea]MBN7795633.1 DUF2288 domain-containing protein [Parahaliea mediterranea]
MAEDTPLGDSPDREALLRREFHGQTARIPWRDLQTYYAHGSVVRVDAALDLVEVAVQLGLDNRAQFETWTGAGLVAPVSDAEALAWFEGDATLWAVVAAPWVLVQNREFAAG